MNTSLIFLTIVLAGCAGKQESPPWNQPTAWTPDAKIGLTPSNYPDDAEDNLTEHQRIELAKLRTAPPPVPAKNPFPPDSSLHAVYLEWYGRGYMFTAATGIESMRPQSLVDSSATRRAKIRGWEDGQFAASQKRLQEVFEELRGQQSGGADAASPRRSP